jgi:hypothetical protein
MSAFIPRAPSNFGRAIALVPSDTVDTPATAIYVGTAGNITCIPVGQTDPVLFKAVSIGFFPVSVIRILATGTTAADMLAL